MNTKNNQRYINTEDKISYALNHLLKEKRLNSITVRELCKEAKIHHTTFYEHYYDIYDLIEKEEQRMEDGLYERLKDKISVNFDYKATLPFITIIINYVKENKDFYTSYLNDYGAASVNSGFNRVWSDIEKSFSDINAHNYTKVRYGFEFSKAGALKVIASWLKDDCKETADEISAILFELLNK